MNVYAKRFRIPNRFRTSLSSDECKVLEVDGVPFVDEYGAFPRWTNFEPTLQGVTSCSVNRELMPLLALI